jgi:maleate cis-trans isomerase
MSGELRARIGLIIPSSNRLSEEQFNEYAPDGVHVHVTRLRMTGPQRIPPEELPEHIDAAAGLLADAKCDVIVYHCTGSSMESGLEAEQAVVSAIAASTGRKATSTASAIVEALHAVDAHNLALVSPYATNDKEIAYLRSAGFETVQDWPMNLAGSDAFISTPSSFWLDTTTEAKDPSADTYLLSCTNIQSAAVIDQLEDRLGRPVITSNQATLWSCLRMCGLNDVIPGLGGLFRLGQRSGAPA